MRPTHAQTFADPDTIDTLPASELLTETAASAFDGWDCDSEAPTVVQTRRPLFAGPPPLPQT